ncbi:MAG: polymer-forming cytoskeletal protein [Chitinispirillaceae bacterium]|nr:polymer-forming cytoskeletal protein [Chitinispirillaceae bacterium]
MGILEKITNMHMTPVPEKEDEMLTMGKREMNEFERNDFTPSKPADVPRAAVAAEKTIIGEHIAVEGSIRANEDMVVEGTVKGTIEVKSHRLTVGSKAKVEADIEADSVIIGGRMVGNVTAKNMVQVTKNADFSGQIKARRISVEDGAFVKASIELEKEEKPAQQQKPATAAAQTAPAGNSAKPSKPEFTKV